MPSPIKKITLIFPSKIAETLSSKGVNILLELNLLYPLSENEVKIGGNSFDIKIIFAAGIDSVVMSRESIKVRQNLTAALNNLSIDINKLVENCNGK